MSLRLRIILTYVLLVAASFSCLIYLIINDVRPRYLEAVEEPIVDFAELLAALLAGQSSGEAVNLGNIDEAMAALTQRKFSAQIYNIHKQRVDLRVYVTDSKGILLYDSSGERQFATDLDASKEVAIYVKLPGGFYISTPVGKYNPDWAISFNEGNVKHIYFVAETKGSMQSMQLREIEKAKIHCAREHFKAISTADVVYDVVDNYESLMNKVLR